MTTAPEELADTPALRGESPMSSMAKMAMFVVLGSAITVAALVIASHLNTVAG